MKKGLWHVILSAVKNLQAAWSSGGLPEILRGAQNDTSKPVFHGFSGEPVMQVRVALYGAARVVIDSPQVDVALDESAGTTTLGQVLEYLCTAFPRVRPYILDTDGMLQSYIRVLINDERPVPDATLATLLRDGDRVTLLVAVAGGASRPGLATPCGPAR